jgi:integral membrane protein
MVEGLSFLLLLGIAMPLKYMADWPFGVRYIGLAHGVLFIAYGLCLLGAMQEAGWPLSRGAKLMGAALVPFGPMLVDRSLAEDEAELDRRDSAGN